MALLELRNSIIKMSNEFSSDQSFAQHLLEQLSENISQLILMVVMLQERNANLPVEEVVGVIRRSSAVANASASVAEISAALANEEYQDYPDIKNEILEASTTWN
ncbi:hypothetical protein PPL_11766 [Heterostelium album PN500]|uniref:Uncharacterized protein n=1 Tax=Heterostelium pallidum (strain ATCC 26659 / Pp 5 / PN500) TaxID=670386 RepID=D3BUE7_HETP5|nr:hypothetical protein PPL_11766 [Heterostelium album PN500]EFA74735.1 hypothetical protein PPL_11766 [Heterostelium album PN500]|eukprot:XP_020426869.1 hypothetical protein PPL_11766 [Heterostelium album PN500]